MPRVINLCGQLNLAQTGLVIREASAVVAQDTGMMYMVTALRKDMVVVWGCTLPGFGMYPVFHAEVLGLECRPCSKLGFDQCPKGHFRFLADQDIETIVRG